MNLLNYGLGYQTWVEFIAIIIFTFLILWTIYPLWPFFWSKTKTKKWSIEKVTKTIIKRSVVTVFVGIFLFLAYGSIDTPQSHRISQDSGMLKMVEEMQNEKPLTEIQEEVIKEEDPLLTRQSSGDCKQEEKQANQYLTGALKRARERREDND